MTIPNPGAGPGEGYKYHPGVVFSFLSNPFFARTLQIIVWSLIDYM
jgi:hypothetical protein